MHNHVSHCTQPTSGTLQYQITLYLHFCLYSILHFNFLKFWAFKIWQLVFFIVVILGCHINKLKLNESFTLSVFYTIFFFSHSPSSILFYLFIYVDPVLSLFHMIIYTLKLDHWGYQRFCPYLFAFLLNYILICLICWPRIFSRFFINWCSVELSTKNSVHAKLMFDK